MNTYTLNNNKQIPIIGFGTYKSTNNKGIEAISQAITNGYRLIDTAAFYKNEETVGEGIKASGIARSDIFVTTKLWRENLGYTSTKQAFEKSLKKLNLDYIDLYLIHWPANAKNYNNWQQTNADTWRAMEELQAEGKIKTLGVSNFWQEHLEALFQTANIIPAINQIEFHPGYWQPELLAFCKKHNIIVEAWSPLARGRIFNHPILKQMAKKHKKTITKICLRWIIQHQVIPIPKSNTPERIKENIDLFDFELNNEDMQLINSISQTGFSGELPNLWPDIV